MTICVYTSHNAVSLAWVSLFLLLDQKGNVPFVVLKTIFIGVFRSCRGKQCQNLPWGQGIENYIVMAETTPSGSMDLLQVSLLHTFHKMYMPIQRLFLKKKRAIHLATCLSHLCSRQPQSQRRVQNLLVRESFFFIDQSFQLFTRK